MKVGITRIKIQSEVDKIITQNSIDPGKVITKNICDSANLLAKKCITKTKVNNPLKERFASFAIATLTLASAST